VASAAGNDEELLREVSSLLEAEESSDQFLSEAAANFLGDESGEAQPDSRLARGEVLANRYRILSLIGRGGMGEVYEAEDLELRAAVALKLVRPEIAMQQEILDRFKREVLLARQVTHPNVCRIFDLGHHSGGPGLRMTFLTMELLAGETLTDRLSRGAMTTAEAQPIVEQLLSGLGAAHRAGIIHRDFKSGNVILLGSEVKIMDFGLARAATGGEQARTTLTAAGGLVGTPAYMAPEQVEGGEITAATDIYALGVVMYEMVTGVLPFTGEGAWVVATKRLREAPVPPRKHVPGLAPLWESVILRCLARDPAGRFQNIDEVHRAMLGEAVARPAAKTRKKAAALPIALTALTLLAVAGGYFLLRQARTVAAPVSAAARVGWRQTALPPDPSLWMVGAVAGSIDPLQLVLFGPSFARAWTPGQTLAPPLTTSFSPAATAACAPGLWIAQADNRHLIEWDAAKQRVMTTIALPFAFSSAACLDGTGTRWGLLSGRAEASRWIEYDASKNRTIRSVPLDDDYLRVSLDPAKHLLVLIAVDRISVRRMDDWQEVFKDTLDEKLIGLWSAAWSRSGRYFSLGFKQLAIYDFAAKRRVQTLATIGWTGDIGWIGDTGIGAMDERGRFYWTADIAKGWQVKQDPPSPGVYRAFWVASHNRWIAFGETGGGFVWEYVAPPLLFDLAVSPIEIWSIAANDDGSRLAAAGKDSRIFMVDPEAKKTVQVLEGHTDGITFLRFAGKRLISASDDKTLRLWDAGSGKLLRTVSGHESLVNAFGLSPDGKWLASVSSDTKVKLWKLPELEYVRDIEPTLTSGAAAAFLGDGARLLTSDWHGNLTSYRGQPPDLAVQQRFRMTQGAIYMVCPSQDAWWAVVYGAGQSGLWLVPANDISQAKLVSEEPTYYCSTSGDGSLTAIQYPGRVELRSNADGKVAASYAFSAREGAAVAIRRNPAMLAAGFADGHVLAWPIEGTVR
jgi:hypothetical protein